MDDFYRFSAGSTEDAISGLRPIFRTQEQLKKKRALRNPFGVFALDDGKLDGKLDDRDLKEKGGQSETCDDGDAITPVDTAPDTTQPDTTQPDTTQNAATPMAQTSDPSTDKTDKISGRNVLAFRQPKRDDLETHSSHPSTHIESVHDALTGEDFTVQFDAWFESLINYPAEKEFDFAVDSGNASTTAMRVVKSEGRHRDDTDRKTEHKTKAQQYDEKPCASEHFAVYESVPHGESDKSTSTPMDSMALADPAEQQPISVCVIDREPVVSQANQQPLFRVRLAWSDGRVYLGFAQCHALNAVPDARSASVAPRDVIPCDYGIMTWSDGCRYEGLFEAGLPHGEGLLVQANGKRLEGVFARGKIRLRCVAQTLAPS
ncbi:MAG: hypothetical protein P8144_14095 [Gammaproteobacteria bacterium]